MLTLTVCYLTFLPRRVLATFVAVCYELTTFYTAGLLHCTTGFTAVPFTPLPAFDFVYHTGTTFSAFPFRPVHTRLPHTFYALPHGTHYTFVDTFTLTTFSRSLLHLRYAALLHHRLTTYLHHYYTPYCSVRWICGFTLFNVWFVTITTTSPRDYTTLPGSRLLRTLQRSFYVLVTSHYDHTRTVYCYAFTLHVCLHSRCPAHCICHAIHHWFVAATRLRLHTTPHPHAFILQFITHVTYFRLRLDQRCTAPGSYLHSFLSTALPFPFHTVAWTFTFGTFYVTTSPRLVILRWTSVTGSTAIY